MLSAISLFEKEMISERTKAKLEQLNAELHREAAESYKR